MKFTFRIDRLMKKDLFLLLTFAIFGNIYCSAEDNQKARGRGNAMSETVAVVDSEGEAVQRNGYYASGTPYVLPCDYNSGGANEMTPVSDRLHIGNRWLSHSGLDWYDNTARMHDPLLMRYGSYDEKWTDYPGISPTAHCGANPANAIDPTGMSVFADQWCQQGIRDGFTEEECHYIRFDDTGMMDNDLLQQCRSGSPNLIALQTLSNSDVKYILEGSSKAFTKDGIAELRIDSEGQLYGYTTMPNVPDAMSIDEDVHIYTSIYIASLKKRASNIAHEAYGHAYFYELSRTDPNINPLHAEKDTPDGYDKSSGESFIYVLKGKGNKALEDQIKTVENIAINNCQNKKWK